MVSFLLPIRLDVDIDRMPLIKPKSIWRIISLFFQQRKYVRKVCRRNCEEGKARWIIQFSTFPCASRGTTEDGQERFALNLTLTELALCSNELRREKAIKRNLQSLEVASMTFRKSFGLVVSKSALP
jgi:hypothetical protein